MGILCSYLSLSANPVEKKVHIFLYASKGENASGLAISLALLPKKLMSR